MGLHANMMKEPVSRLALREPVLGAADETVSALIEKMRAGKLGCAIIVDADQKPIGMFTESMLTQLLAHNPEALSEPVAQHMAERWPWVLTTDPIADVLEAMQVKNVRFICVVDEEGRVAGLTGQKGLMEYIAEHFPGQVMVQHVASAPYTSREGA